MVSVADFEHSDMPASLVHKSNNFPVSMKIADIKVAALQQVKFPTIQPPIKQALIKSV